MYRRLTKANPARYEPNLAMSLNNLSACLSYCWRQRGSAEGYPRGCGCTPSSCGGESGPLGARPGHELEQPVKLLEQLGDNAGAPEAIQEAVDVYRRLAAANPARYEPDLAMSLNNLSLRLSDSGDNAGALAAIREAVEIRRRLAAANPARYEPDLAVSLNNLSSDLSDSGDNEGALAAIREAVDVYRRLAAANPARDEPDLAMSLGARVVILKRSGSAGTVVMPRLRRLPNSCAVCGTVAQEPLHEIAQANRI